MLRLWAYIYHENRNKFTVKKMIIKLSEKYLDMEFIYLYICLLFLRTIFSFPKPFGRKTQILFELISNNKIYNACLIRRGNTFFCPSYINNKTFNF
jgi:hypothetical protein